MPEDNVSDETTEAPQVDATATAPTEPVAEAAATEEATAPLVDAPVAEADSTEPAPVSGETASTEEAPTTVSTDTPTSPEVAAEDDEVAEETAAFATVEEAMAEITKLRSENAAKRVSNREFNEKLTAIQEAFGGDEDFQEGWLALAAQFAADPDDPETKAIFARLAGVDTGEGAPSLDENAILAKVSKAYEAQQQQLAVQRIENELTAKALELGYNPDVTEETDPVAFANNRLLWATVQTIPAEAGDTNTTRLEKADAKVKAYEQAVFDRKLAELSAVNTGIPVTSGAGVADQSSEDDSTPPAGLSPKQKMKWAYDRSIRLAEQQKQTPSF